MALDVNTAGTEFVKSVLILYRSNKYFREKEILAKKLLDYAIEAGRLVSELGGCSEYEAGATALKAKEELKRTLFILNVMSEESIYPKRRIQPVKTLGENIIQLVELFITEQPPCAQPAPAEAVQTVAAAQPVPQLQQDNSEQLSLAGNVQENDGGFNDIYFGTI